MKHNRIAISISIIGLAALILMLNVTSPTEIGPLGVLLFFTTLYMITFSVASLVMQAFFYFSVKNQENQLDFYIDYQYKYVVNFLHLYQQLGFF